MQTQSAITIAVSKSKSALPASPTALAPKASGRRGAADLAVLQLHRVNLRSVIEAQGKRLVSVDYEKLNGEQRTLTGRRGVTAYLKGGENKVVRDSRSYMTLFDMQLKEYRTVNLATVTELRCARHVYRVID